MCVCVDTSCMCVRACRGVCERSQCVRMCSECVRMCSECVRMCSECVRMCSECVRMSRVYTDMCVYTDRACVYAGLVKNVHVVSVFVCVCSYGVPTISRLLKIIGLFRRI